MLFYHPTYGFVRLNYQMVNGQLLNLTLVKAGMQYPSDYWRFLSGQLNQAS